MDYITQTAASPSLEADLVECKYNVQYRPQVTSSSSLAKISSQSSNGSMQPRQRRKVPEGELCAVCSDRATGYHYGTPSCNGCKTFFRRTIVSGHTFVCQYNGNCDVNKNVRCACRHCRFNKCIAVGMDARAIQNDRDRIGPTKKFKMEKRSSSADDDQLSINSSPSQQHDHKLVDHLYEIEQLCNKLRTSILYESNDVKATLAAPCLLYQVNNMETDQNTVYGGLRQASLKDIKMWNIRELRSCLEWVKTFEEFIRLDANDQLALDKIVYPNGAYILRDVQESVKIPGCRSIYHRQMDEIMLPFRNLVVSEHEFATFKAVLLFNPDANDLSPDVKNIVAQERTKYLTALFYWITSKHGMTAGVQKYAQLLMMAPSIQNIIDQNDENMQVMQLFEHIWRIDSFVKELCMR